MGLMGVVLYNGLFVCVDVVVVILDDVDPVAQCIFAGDEACAVVGKFRGHVEGEMWGGVGKGGCEVAADDDCAIRFSVLDISR